jgi:hypothetical protein
MNIAIHSDCLASSGAKGNILKAVDRTREGASMPRYPADTSVYRRSRGSTTL